MYLAELRGKLSKNIEHMEDVLTSNVFSFFKYSTRDIFLKGFVNDLGFDISTQDARMAQFLFWPRLDDHTEPDLVILVGHYYLLLEAKYFSGFAGEAPKTKAQLVREVEGGELDARNRNREFWFVAVTADHYMKQHKFRDVPLDARHRFKWINWQSVSAFLYRVLESDVGARREEIAFARDLYDLLDRKGLRGFQGSDPLTAIGRRLNTYGFVFFTARSAIFRGDFIGFERGLAIERKIDDLGPRLFLKGRKRRFEFRGLEQRLISAEGPVFFKEGYEHGYESRPH